MPYLVRRRANRRRRRRRRNAWSNDARGHAKAARLGWRRRKRGGRRRRRNPALTIRHAANPRRRRRRRRNCPTTRVNRRRRRTRRNQPRIIRQLTSQKVLMSGATIGGGIVLGAVTMPLVDRMIPANNRAQFSPFLGIVNIAIGALMYGMLRNRMAKQLGLVVAGTGVYDLVAENIPQLSLPSMRATALVNQMMPAAIAPNGAAASYQVARRPVSPVARLSASYPSPARAGYSASYADPGMRTEGFGSTDPYAGIEGWDG